MHVIALLRNCIAGTEGTVSLVPFLGTSIDFSHVISAGLHLTGFEDACRLSFLQIFVEGSWECCLWSPLPASNISGCEILVYGQLCRGVMLHDKHMSKQTLLNFDSQSRESRFKSHCGHFEPLASLITPRCHSSLNCINEYLAIQTVVER